MTVVSVVLPTHNRAALLGRAIGSVLAQSFHSLELIVVDDGSTDDTAAIVGAINDPRLRYERLAIRGGVSRARNRGIELAQGDWIALQDSDDAWLPYKLEQQLAAAREDTALVVTRDRVLEDAALSYARARSAASVIDVTNEATFRLPPAATWLARRADVVAAGGFDATFDCYEDWDLGLRLAMRGRILLVNDVLVERRRTEGSLFSDEASRRRNLELIVARHRATLAAHPAAWSYYCNALGQMAAVAGDLDESRRWFRAALRARPFAFRTWANLLMSAFGKSAFEKYLGLARAVRRILASAP